MLKNLCQMFSPHYKFAMQTLRDKCGHVCVEVSAISMYVSRAQTADMCGDDPKIKQMSIKQTASVDAIS